MPKDVQTINFTKHFSGNNHEQMNALLTPLKSFGIKGFKHFRIYDDNSGVNFTTMPEYLDIFTVNKLWRFAGGGDYKDYHDGYYLWDWLEPNLAFQAVNDFYRFGNGLTIIKKNESFVDQLFFVADKGDYNVNYFYLHHRDVIERFLAYYYQEAESLHQQGTKHSYFFPSDKKEIEQILNPDILNLLANSKKIITPSSRKLRYYKNHLNFVSPRELEVINLTSQGHSAKIVAYKLGISSKTVERHLENARIKVGAKNVVELCVTVYKLNNCLKQY